MTVYNITVETDLESRILVRHAMVFADNIKAAVAYGVALGGDLKSRVVVEPQRYEHQKQSRSQTVLV